MTRRHVRPYNGELTIVVGWDDVILSLYAEVTQLRSGIRQIVARIGTFGGITNPVELKANLIRYALLRDDMLTLLLADVQAGLKSHLRNTCDRRSTHVPC